MKKLLVIGMVSLMVSCKPDRNLPTTKTTFQIGSEFNPLEIVVIDSCEYLYGPWGNGTVLTHKGNCKHCKNKN